MGTLKVTCSRLGISLRRPRVKLLPPKDDRHRENGWRGERDRDFQHLHEVQRPRTKQSIAAYTKCDQPIGS